MPIVVMKFGGTSVGTVERIQAVADRVVRAREGGDDVIVVVSAMGDTTDDLTAMALRIADVPDPREMDMLLTAGERIAMSLLGIALNARGCRAASYTGSQAGIITDTQHGKAKIVEIRPKRVVEALEAGNVVVLAGFQGLSTRYEITTLGRGASDLTAVAMAGAVGAKVCEICIRRTRGSSRTPAGSRRSAPTRCSSSRLAGRRCCSRARWRWHVAMACSSMCGPPSARRRVPGCGKMRSGWKA